MPTYVYGCVKCENKFERQELIANRKVPLESPCSECGSEIEMLPAALPIVSEITAGRVKTPLWWQERLQKIKSQHRGSTIKTERTLGS